VAAVLLGTALAWWLRPAMPRTTTASVFGTIAEITADKHDQAAVDAVLARWQQRERDWHPWRPSSLTAFNAALAASTLAEVPVELQPLFTAALPAKQASTGWFDPGVGELVAAWGFHTSDYPVRTPAPTAAWRADWQARPPCWSMAEHRVTTCGRAPRFDFNALAEGVALAEARDHLHGLGVRNALLNLGGDVLAIGSKHGTAWRVGLHDGDGGVLGGVALRDGEAFLSSGRYAKYRIADDGARWPHVLNPFSAEPAHAARLSAVLHTDPAWADAAATALLAAGPAHFAALTQSMHLGCALLVDDAGRVWITHGLAGRFTWQQALPEAARIDRGEHCATAAAE
jgi:thiamine biosynthesis lipoprotein